MSKTVRQEAFIIFQLMLLCLICGIILFFKNIPLAFSTDVLFSLTDVVTVYVLFYIAFCKWLWRCPIFKWWLVIQPDINGNWVGSIETKWKNQKKNIPVKLRITQELLSVKCKMSSDESDSRSMSGHLYFDEKHDDWYLVSSYQNVPLQKYREKSPIHYGTIMLNIKKQKNNFVLTGEYWTSRKTVGDIELKKANKYIK